MNKKTVLRLLALISICLLMINCSSSDDGDSDSTVSNKAKIIGIWYKTEQCAEQNNYTFNENLNYELLSSGNINCTGVEAEATTFKYTGTYNIVDNELFFNQQTTEVFIEGNTLSVNDFDLNTSVKFTIETLTDTNLLIKTTITSDSGVTNYSNSYQR